VKRKQEITPKTPRKKPFMSRNLHGHASMYGWPWHWHRWHAQPCFCRVRPSTASASITGSCPLLHGSAFFFLACLSSRGFVRSMFFLVLPHQRCPFYQNPKISPQSKINHFVNTLEWKRANLTLFHLDLAWKLTMRNRDQTRAKMRSNGGLSTHLATYAQG